MLHTASTLQAAEHLLSAAQSTHKGGKAAAAGAAAGSQGLSVGDRVRTLLDSMLSEDLQVGGWCWLRGVGCVWLVDAVGG